MTRFSEEDDSKKSQNDKNLEEDNSLTRQKQDSLEAGEESLNAKYSDYDEAEENDSSAFFVSSRRQFIGPVPPPEILKSYEENIPGSAERLIRMAEKEQDHRHEMQKKLVDGQLNNTKRFYDERKRGQIFGLTIGLIGIISGSILAFNDKQIAGSFIGTAGIGGIVSVFVIGRGKSKDENNQTRLPSD